MSVSKKLGQEVVAATTRRGVRIFRVTRKRADGSAAVDPNFQYRVWRGGRRVYFQLPSRLSDAIAEADKIDTFLDIRSNSLDDAIKTFDPDRWALKNPAAKTCTVAQLLTAHEAAEKALGLNSRTALGYRQSLIILFSDSLSYRRKRVVADDDIKAMPLDEFTARLVADFKVARVSLAGDDKAAQESKKRSANGVLRSVRALFSAPAREHYSALKLPDDLDAVLANMAFRKVGKIAKRLPSSEVIRTLFSAIASVRTEDENLYLAFLLAAHAGLRKAEVAAARLSWLDESSTPPRLWVRTEDDFTPKSGADRFIELQPWVAAELATLCKDRKHMLTGTLTERVGLVFRRLNTWVKDRHFNEANGEKGVHGLRFLFGAYVTNRKERGGLYTAMKFLGHESQSTTEKHYADIMLDQSIFACWETAPIQT